MFHSTATSSLMTSHLTSERTPGPRLELQGVSASYNGAEILQKINLEVDAGGRLALMGSSGVGKTTLVRTMSGLMAPTTGRVLLNGRDIDGPTKEISVVFQRGGCFPWLGAWQNLMFPLKMLGLHRDGAELDRARELLRKIGLERSENLFPHQMSGGMLQRLSLIRAIVGRPQVIILDEPFSALDPVLRAEMRDLLRDLQRAEGFAFILVTHDVVDALDLAHSVIVLHDRPATTSMISVMENETPQQMLRQLEPFLHSTQRQVRDANH